MIARIATLFFEGSEMADMALAWKLEHVLSKIFKSALKQKLFRNKIVVEEFSDSDDDY